jgi:hypothetical protein
VYQKESVGAVGGFKLYIFLLDAQKKLSLFCSAKVFFVDNKANSTMVDVLYYPLLVYEETCPFTKISNLVCMNKKLCTNPLSVIRPFRVIEAWDNIACMV